jgi:hypothetical protein
VTNVVQVTVTAQDGMTTRTYVVNVVELPDQTVKPVLTNSFNNGTLTLNWPLKNLGYRLLVQTNNLANGISTNASDWYPVLNSAATNTATINTTNVDDYYITGSSIRKRRTVRDAWRVFTPGFIFTTLPPV